MKDLKYEYLYNSLNEITHISDAIKGEFYKMYKDEPLSFMVRDGDVNQKHFALIKESTNPFEVVGIIGGGSESPEHFNAKMKIAKELKYYDTIFKTDIHFDEVIAEKLYDVKKRPDLSCYQNGVLVACIEVFNTSKKSEEDIEKLKELDCLIVEIDIKNENRCKHIALPKMYEPYRTRCSELEGEIEHVERRSSEARESIGKLKRKIFDIISEIRKQQRVVRADRYRRLSDAKAEVKRLEGPYRNVEQAFKNKDYKKLKIEADIFLKHYGK